MYTPQTYYFIILYKLRTRVYTNRRISGWWGKKGEVLRLVAPVAQLIDSQTFNLRVQFQVETELVAESFDQ